MIFPALLSLLLAITMLNQAICFPISPNQESHKTLIYYTLPDPIVLCGDGSPAGFYTNAYTSKKVKNKHHIINFMGGAACATSESCAALYENHPYSLSSLFEPSRIEGHTFLSDDPIENTAMALYTKWNVQYCSQDSWLGDSRMSGNFFRSGSVHVKAFLNYWLNEVIKAEVQIDVLVITGVSAGTMAVLNHINMIQSVTEAAGVKSLRIILDSSLYNDELDLEFTSLIEEIVNPDDHPLCFKESSNSFQHEMLSKLPCCLSTHCMIRHSDSLRHFVSTSPTGSLHKDMRLLLIDSAYDYLQVFLHLSSISNIVSLSNISLFDVGEIGGSRKNRVIETLFGGERDFGSNIVWALSSAVIHSTLLPSADLDGRICYSSKQGTIQSCDGQDCIFSNYPLGLTVHCNATGVGLKLPLDNDLDISLWYTKDAWKLVSVNGLSIQEIISRFLDTNYSPSSKIESSSKVTGLMMDSCMGPNCVSKDAVGKNPSQSLIEIDDAFVHLPLLMCTLLLTIIILIPLMYAIAIFYKPIFCFKKTVKMKKKSRKKRAEDIKNRDIYVENLCVHSKSGVEILDDICIHLKSSSLNCLLGKSGSGKSTLLGVLR